jgi:hypothetical protein
MNKFIFILLNILLSGLLSGSILGVIAHLKRDYAPHPHQIIPTWMFFFIVGFIITACVTILWSIFYGSGMNPSLIKTVPKMAVIGAAIAGAGILYWKRKNNS